VSRALAAATLWICWLRNGHSFPVSGHGAPGATGLWAWDAAWYRSIAEHGYGGQLHAHGERFFPLLPLLGRWVGAVFGGHPGAALLVIANVSALGFGVGVALLAQRELGDRAAAATWLTLLAPGGAVLAVAYAEALAGMLAVAYLLAVRARGAATWWAVPAGVLGGLARPTGFLIAVVPLVELWLSRHDRDRRRQSTLLAAVAAPAVGAAVYCLWTAAVDGDLLLPFTAQSSPGLRGGMLANPLHGLFVAPNRAGMPVPLRVAVVVLALALLVLVWRRLPPSIALWSTVLLLAAVTSAQGTSLPRYLSTDFPLLLALGAVASRRGPAVVACMVSAAAFVAVGVSGFGSGMVF